MEHITLESDPDSNPQGTLFPYVCMRAIAPIAWMTGDNSEKRLFSKVRVLCVAHNYQLINMSCF